MRIKRKVAAGVAGIALLTAGSLVTAPVQAAPSTSRATFSVPVTSTLWASEESWCDNTGPHITVRSSTDTGGASMRLQLKNNVKGTHNVAVVGTYGFTVLEPTIGEAAIFKQPPLGGVGGNPFMYIVDSDDVWHYIGRCVQDGKIGQINHGRFSATTSVPAYADATVQALECSNKGSSLRISTTAGSGGVSGALVFTNSSVDVSVKRDPTHINSDSGIVASWGFSLSAQQIRKGGGEPKGPGGNPLISTSTGTVDNLGVYTANTPEVDRGRCNKLY